MTSLSADAKAALLWEDLEACRLSPAARSIVSSRFGLTAVALGLSAVEGRLLEAAAWQVIEDQWRGVARLREEFLSLLPQGALDKAIRARGRLIAHWAIEACRPLCPADTSLTLLDVGAGDGLVAQQVQEALPRLRVTCADLENHLVVPMPFVRLGSHDDATHLQALPQADIVMVNHVTHHIGEDGPNWQYADWSQADFLCHLRELSSHRIVLTDSLYCRPAEHPEAERQAYLMLDWYYTHIIRGWTIMDCPGSFHTAEDWATRFAAAGLQIVSVNVHPALIGINPKQDVTFVLAPVR